MISVTEQSMPAPILDLDEVIGMIRDLRESEEPENLQAAFRYASQGKAVFPLWEIYCDVCSCGDSDCSKPGNHPRTPHGYQDATTDLMQVWRWWREWPGANIGIATGDGFVALDVDPRNGGDQSLARLEKAYGPLPETVESLTGGGGRHLLFAVNGQRLRNCDVGPGLELKALGGYVLVPPSNHISGRRYEWKRSPADMDFEPLPDWVRAEALRVREATPAVNGSPIPRGQRNETLTSLAGTMRRKGMTQEEILAALAVVNRQRCKPSLEDAEVQGIATSVSRYRPADSFPATKERGLQETNSWDPVPLSALAEGESIRWIWYGYLVAGGITLLSGRAKAGKTTLIAYAIQKMESGGDLGGTIRPGGVLVVSEEPGVLWARRRDELEIGDHAECLCRPFMGRPDARLWGKFIDYVVGLVKKRKYAVVMLDPFASLCPSDDENDAAKMLAALTPLRAITDAGASLLLVHHLRKSDGVEGTGARGSGALVGFVDVVCELRGDSHGVNTRRVLTGLSRFAETPTEVVLDLGEQGYTAQGTREEANKQARVETIERILPAESPGKTCEEVLEAWSGNRPGERTLRGDLREGARGGKWVETGDGKKGDPYRYRLPDRGDVSREDS